MPITPEELINRVYKDTTFHNMNRRQFYTSLLEVIDGVEDIKNDEEYAGALKEIKDLNSRTDQENSITDSEKSFYLKKLIFIAGKSNTGNPLLRKLVN